MTNILNNNIPWIEKYRPTSLDDIIGNSDAISRLKIIVLVVV